MSPSLKSPSSESPPPESPPPAAAGRTVRPALVVGLVVVGIVVLATAPSGLGSVLVGVGVVALVTGVWAVLVGRAWVGRLGRGGGLVVTVGAVLLIGLGGALSDSLEDAENPDAQAQTAVGDDDTPPAERGALGGAPDDETRPSVDPGQTTSPAPDEPGTPTDRSGPTDGPSSDASTTPARPDAAAGAALATVDLLEVKGRAPKTGYDRDAFAYRAVDLDRNGCDTRNDILNRDLTGITHRPGTGGCTVETGTLADPYSGTSIAFRRGTGTSNDIQIDHVVALSDAWQKGAQQWGPGTLRQFGNDPLNLLAVSGPLNAQKGDGDTATWLPPNKAYRCPYVARQVAVKHHYGLWVTSAERDAMIRVLSACPDEPLPTGTEPPPRVAVTSPAPAASPPAAPATSAPPSGSSATPTAPFKNCAAARAAGADPVHIGDPGYGPHLDGDGDGVGCE